MIQNSKNLIFSNFFHQLGPDMNDECIYYKVKNCFRVIPLLGNSLECFILTQKNIADQHGVRYTQLFGIDTSTFKNMDYNVKYAVLVNQCSKLVKS